MRRFSVAVVFLLPFGQAASAQVASATPPEGIATEWTIRGTVAAVVSGVQKLRPLLDQAKPDRWGDQVHARDYAGNWESAQRQLEYLAGAGDRMTRQPESLTAALELFLRLQSFEAVTVSLIEGVKRYHSPDLAVMLRNAITGNNNNQEKVKQYLVDLTATREKEFQIMDSEAQRCRGTVSKAAISSKNGKKVTQK